MDADEVSAAVPWVGTARIPVGPLRAVEGTVRVDRAGVALSIPGRPEVLFARDDAVVTVDAMGGVLVGGRRGRRRRMAFGAPPLTRVQSTAIVVGVVAVVIAVLALDLPIGTVPVVVALMLMLLVRLNRAHEAAGAASPDRAAMLDALGAVGLGPTAMPAGTPDIGTAGAVGPAAWPPPQPVRRHQSGQATAIVTLLFGLGLIAFDLMTTTPQEAQVAAAEAAQEEAEQMADHLRTTLPLPDGVVITVTSTLPGQVHAEVAVPFAEVHDHAIAAGLTVERTSDIFVTYLDDGEPLFTAGPLPGTASTAITLGG